MNGHLVPFIGVSVNLGELLLISMPVLTEETRRGFTKQARDAAEDGRVAVRNIRRDAS